MSEIKLEVCVDSIQSAVAAAEGGASRIELCSALLEGGLTPTCGVLKTLKAMPLLADIPIFCMLRSRRGNDFCYTQHEMDAMLADMQLLGQYGADGFVFGALTSDRTIDLESCQRIVRHAGDSCVTFHRAFDLTQPAAMHATISQLRELGFKRILSSGFRQTAAEGSELLAELIARHRDMIIMPGAGISIANLDEILTTTKCIEFHASAMSAAGDLGNRMDCDISMGKQDTEPFAITDVNVVRKMVAIARAMHGR